MAKDKATNKTPSASPDESGQITGPPLNVNEPYKPALWERILAGICAVAILALVFFVVLRKEPFADQNQVVLVRKVLSLAVSVIGAVVPGFLQIDLSGKGVAIRAGGALALFVITFFFSPKVLPLAVDKAQPGEAGSSGVKIDNSSAFAGRDIINTINPPGDTTKIENTLSEVNNLLRDETARKTTTAYVATVAPNVKGEILRYRKNDGHHRCVLRDNIDSGSSWLHPDGSYTCVAEEKGGFRWYPVTLLRNDQLPYAIPPGSTLHYRLKWSGSLIPDFMIIIGTRIRVVPVKGDGSMEGEFFVERETDGSQSMLPVRVYTNEPLPKWRIDMRHEDP